MEQTNTFVRFVAVKSTIGRISTYTFVQEDEQNSNYLQTADGQKIFRLNVIGIIVNKEKQGSITNLLLDDSTGKIILRSFEENKNVRELVVGDMVMVIGRVRVYNQEKYLSAEIIKKMDSMWMKIRRLELKEEFNQIELKLVETEPSLLPKIEIKPAITISSAINESIEEEIIEEEVQGIQVNPLLPAQKVLLLIKELDTGGGAPIEEIISKSPLNGTEKLLEQMLQKGDIFQNLPGKVKVL
jgi:RPA family protein